jgi:N-carbamoylputrescine amidase
MTFTVACAQFAPVKAEVNRNLDRIAEFALQASSEGADLVAFPESACSGYFLEGGVLESALGSRQLLEELARRLAGLKKPLDLHVGFYENSDGHLYNSAAYMEFGFGEPRLVHVYRKFFLPTYGVFDEERFVGRGTELGVFDTRFGRMACLICEDAWHSILPALCALQGVRTILIPSASPARGFDGPIVGNLDRYMRMLRGVSEEHAVYCVNTQLCGFEGGKGFVGGSMVVDPSGRVIAQSPIQEEHLLLCPIDLDLIDIQRAQFPLLSDLRGSWHLVRKIVGETALTDD